MKKLVMQFSSKEDLRYFLFFFFFYRFVSFVSFFISFFVILFIYLFIFFEGEVVCVCVNVNDSALTQVSKYVLK